ncbi:branched-chain amino acid ABC transporter permease [Oceanotoga sp. DSM 15011]|jgi:branched-chain amino acid transport system permease protein|uniref:Amino acid/amide ABC transporter membrane protein 1 (HAAT family) n=1 Tax=Oceanotoga teriensis TaxID=515440 RepID=A0AA45C9E6_9BACT|nr:MULTISPECIES: branched-chain amino acid ABC transporter permease [Oceanotoga]MDN5342964.1 branched-chain amino acid transport system permease protein [Oceanotoga sp.]MDO7975305.1 branched-chain amino acid ABC transporter permease [Oceanotoga teriensis]PWJ96637.1 amino acid/amide ABC transporter membrane protein 1 (HAAT family) [Oceanotoga teriensis]UYP00192.1 branched-chain amino acid ABC transporter permease [Oceanotoga sp. DSM 15011]
MLIIQSIILGIPQGALYGLMAFGIALIFRTVSVMNFSHGNAGMFATFIGFSVYTLTNNIFIALISAVVFGFILGVLIEKFLMRPVKHLSHGAMLIITLGLLMVFEGLSIVIWGTEYLQLPELNDGMPIIMEFGENILVLPINDLIVTVIALSVSILLAIFLKYTKIGTAIRARAQDEVGSSVVGIDINKVDSIVWGIGISLAALVGILAAPKTYVHPNMMTNMQLYGFTAGVLGGFSSLFGAIVGGMILGILEKVVGVYISPDYQLSIILILIIVVLVVKPSGIFGKKFEGRV